MLTFYHLHRSEFKDSHLLYFIIPAVTFVFVIAAYLYSSSVFNETNDVAVESNPQTAVEINQPATVLGEEDTQ